MTFIFIVVFSALIAAIAHYIYRYFAGKTMVVTDDLYAQNGVKIDYKARTITIKKHSYDVNKVTGLKTTYGINGSRNAQHVRIEVDDLSKPVHTIVIIGSERRAQEFVQRLSVALRKASGPNFS